MQSFNDWPTFHPVALLSCAFAATSLKVVLSKFQPVEWSQASNQHLVTTFLFGVDAGVRFHAGQSVTELAKATSTSTLLSRDLS